MTVVKKLIEKIEDKRIRRERFPFMFPKSNNGTIHRTASPMTSAERAERGENSFRTREKRQLTDDLKNRHLISELTKLAGHLRPSLLRYANPKLLGHEDKGENDEDSA
jgi:hypothetical protein